MLCTYVVIDFSIGNNHSTEPLNTRINLPELDFDRPYFIKSNNRQLLVIRYSESLRNSLFEDIAGSNQAKPKYLVAYGYGTNLGCPLQPLPGEMMVKESCSQARYDFAGRALDATQGFPALRVPVYNFCPDLSCLNLSL